MAEAGAARHVILQFDHRQSAKHSVANVHGVTDRFQGQRMFRHAGHEIQPRPHSQRKDEVVVIEGAFTGERATGNALTRCI